MFSVSEVQRRVITNPTQLVDYYSAVNSLIGRVRAAYLWQFHCSHKAFVDMKSAFHGSEDHLLIVPSQQHPSVDELTDIIHNLTGSVARDTHLSAQLIVMKHGGAFTASIFKVHFESGATLRINERFHIEDIPALERSSRGQSTPI